MDSNRKRNKESIRCYLNVDINARYNVMEPDDLFDRKLLMVSRQHETDRAVLGEGTYAALPIVLMEFKVQTWYTKSVKIKHKTSYGSHCSHRLPEDNRPFNQ